MKLDIVMNADLKNCLKAARELLFIRHHKIDDDQYGYIKDNLTINLKEHYSGAEDEHIENYDKVKAIL